jgi:hypothetical protein
MRFRHFALVIALICAVATLAQDQNQPQHPAEPTITFDVYWEAATPQHYTIKVQSSGSTTYVSRNPTRPEQGAEQATDPDYEQEFTISPATRDRIFQLARSLNYFQGDFDFKQHKVANTGKKTLTYADPTRNFQTTYNWSENNNLQQLTSIFRGISNTIEHGRKLQFLRRFDKLGLENELKAMENLAENKELAEVQIIAPILRNIVNDPSFLHIARQRAERLLALAGPAKDQDK